MSKESDIFELNEHITFLLSKINKLECKITDMQSKTLDGFQHWFNINVNAENILDNEVETYLRELKKHIK